jgi:hypothetical protein
VLNVHGRVVGMAVLGPRRRVLAIPASTIDRVVEQLLVLASRPASEAATARPPGSITLIFSSRSKTCSAGTMTPERQWMPLEGHRPPP